MDQRSSLTTFSLAVIGMAAPATVAVWQFYLFTVVKGGALDVQGGAIHLWLALGSALIGCTAGFFFFSRLFSYITLQGHRAGVARIWNSSR